MADHALLAWLSAHAYGVPGEPPLPATVQEIAVPQSLRAGWAETGFSGAVYRHTVTNELIVVARGTELTDPGDLRSDTMIAFGVRPTQYFDALDLYHWARSTQLQPGQQMVLTGHSLGGTLMQLVRLQAAVEGVTELPTVTFGAPGAQGLYGAPEAVGPMPDVINYLTPFDILGRYGDHVGTTVTVPSLGSELAAYERRPLDAVTFIAAYLTFHGINAYWDLMLRAQALAMYSPLVLDLDGDGVETRAPAGAFFDHAGDGHAERTGWAAPDDGLLALDRDGDGRIEDGRELFGTSTPVPGGGPAADGFAALAALDANGDGRVDAADPAWGALRVWRDADGDGASAPGELHALDALGVARLDTASTPSGAVDAAGNAHRLQGSFRWADGRSGAMSDVWFVVDPLHALPPSPAPIPEDIAALPDAAGFGRVPGLRQTMARDASGRLRGLVEGFAGESDPERRLAAAEAIILAWTGADTVDPAARGPFIDARILTALERFSVRDYRGADGLPDPNAGAAPLLLQAWDVLRELVQAQLAAQTHLADLVELVRYDWDPVQRRVVADLGAVEAALTAELAADRDAGRTRAAELARVIRGLGAEDLFDYWGFRDRLAAGDAELAWRMDAAGRTLLAGTPAADALTGGAAAEALRGGDGDDTLAGDRGRDALHGDAGRDRLEGGDQADLLVGGDGDDTLGGGEGDDRLEGGPGADGLAGDAGRDTLVGGPGNDSLWGGDGDDALDGGPGEDWLDGGFGDDRYLLRRGGGADQVNDRDWQFADADRIVVAADIRPDEVGLRREGDDLVVEIVGSGDRMRVLGWFLEGFGATWEVQRVEFLADGTVWDAAAIRDRLIRGTPGADMLVGYSWDDVIAGGDGDDVIGGRGGADVLDGGPAHDAVWGDAGADRLTGGPGADTLRGGDGDDLLEGGPGDDWLEGGFGTDTYRVGRGEGRDTIEDADWQLPDADRLVLAPDLAPADVQVARAGDDLVLRLAGGPDQVTVRGWFAWGFPNYHELSRVEFADGTVWDQARLEQLALGIHGTPGPDTLTGTAGPDLLLGHGGDDVLRGGGGADLLDGGPGADALYGEAGDDRYVVDDPGDMVVEAPGEGLDTVESAVSFTLPAEVEDLVLTGSGAVNGTGNALANRLTGNAAANTLDGGPGADVLAGGAGDDVYVVDAAGDQVVELAGGGRDTVRAGVSFTLPAEVEDLVLTGTAALTGTGNGLANRLTGNGAGNRLDGGPGADILAGGGGGDSYVVDDPGDVVIESGSGTDTVWSAVSFALPASVERLVLTGTAPIDGTGNGLANTLTGNAARNVLTGGGGNDTYVVQNVDDVVVEAAGAGLDLVQSSVSYTLPANVEKLTLTGTAPASATGNGLANTLTGNNAANVLDGGAGNDSLVGMHGGDTYRFAPGSGQDTITDNDSTRGVVDTARFEGGLRPLDLVLSRVANDLLVQVQGSGDAVTVRNWYLSPYNHVEVLAAGGQQLASSRVDLLIQDMAQWSAATGLSWAQGVVEEPEQVQAVLAAHWQPA
jgi:Ca2+-binding RTX toxin-like protein